MGHQPFAKGAVPNNGARRGAPASAGEGSAESQKDRLRRKDQPEPEGDRLKPVLHFIPSGSEEAGPKGATFRRAPSQPSPSLTLGMTTAFDWLPHEFAS